MNKKIFIILILILAFFLRTFSISDFPKTLYGDEQAFAWNAYSILKTGQDEYGTPYPLQFRSFDDYKAPIPVYLLAPFIHLFGLNALGIRLLISLAGTLTVLVAYFLFKIFFNKKIALLGTFLFAISPWHVHLSRGFFESTLSLLFFITGIWLYLKRPTSLQFIISGSILFTATLYSYFTPRIYLPIFFLGLSAYLLYFHKAERIKIVKNLILGITMIIILSLPLIKVSLFDKGLSRIGKLIATNQPQIIETINRERHASNLPLWAKIALHNKATGWARFIGTNYLELLSTNYLFITGDTSLRYFLGNMGMLYLYELPLFLIGVYFMVRQKPLSSLFFFLWLAVMPIPAAIAGKPFGVRSLGILPAPFAFIAYGIYALKRKTLFNILLSVIFIVSLGNLLIRYYFEYPVFAATWWGWENKAALDYAKQRENDYDYIFISDFYSGLPLAYAVYNSLDPLEYRKALQNPVTLAKDKLFIKFGKYYIGSFDIDREYKKELLPVRSLYIGRPEEVESTTAIGAPDDGRVLFRVYSKNK